MCSPWRESERTYFVVLGGSEKEGELMDQEDGGRQHAQQRHCIGRQEQVRDTEVV